MGRLMNWLFRGVIEQAKDSNTLLIQQMMEVQSQRLKYDSELDHLKRELEFKQKQLEMDNLEAISEEKRKDRIAREQLRAIRQQNAAKARLAKTEKANGALMRNGAVPGRVSGCVVCADPSNASLTSDEIKWHSAGHPGAMA